MIAAAVLLVAGAAAGVGLRRWLVQERYRYDDERALPSRSTWWVVPVLAVAAGALGYRAEGSVAVLVTYAVGFVWMAGLAAIDLDTRRLPDRWTLPSYAVWAVLLAWCTWATDAGAGAWIAAVACGLGNGLVHLMLALVSPDGLGLGDVKLSVALGMLTGWLAWPAVLLAFLGAFCLGLVVGLVAAVRTGAGRKATFPFGPSMLAAAALAVLLFVPAAT